MKNIHFVQRLDLQPCPFCGNSDPKTIFVQNKEWNVPAVYIETEITRELTGSRYSYVECFECGARTDDVFQEDVPVIYGEYLKTSVQVAIELWNTRTPPKNNY